MKYQALRPKFFSVGGWVVVGWVGMGRVVVVGWVVGVVGWVVMVWGGWWWGCGGVVGDVIRLSF